MFFIIFPFICWSCSCNIIIVEILMVLFGICDSWVWLDITFKAYCTHDTRFLTNVKAIITTPLQTIFTSPGKEIINYCLNELKWSP